VVTSDSHALQETIGISGDRQSASELARRAERPPRRPSLGIDVEDYQLYQQFQQEQYEGPADRQRPEMKREVTQDVSIDHHPGLGIGF